MPNEVKLLPCPFCGREPISTDHGALVFHQIAPCPLSKQHFDPRIWATRPTIVTDEVVEPEYTLKRVEAEAIELMRAAADREGMKIGAWVSMRLQESANRVNNECQVHGTPFISPGICPFCDEEARAAIAAMPAIVGGEERGDAAV